MAIHVLGNGPSLTLFDRSKCSVSDVVVGCNFSDETLAPHYTVMTDTRPLRKVIKDAFSSTIPYVLSHKGRRYLECERKHEFKKITIRDSIPVQKYPSVSPKFPMNSGMHAVLYALEHEDPSHKEVFLWGMDSFWTGGIESSTDALVPKSRDMIAMGPAKVYGAWMKYWSLIFSENPDIIFRIMMPHLESNKLGREISSIRNVEIC